MSIEDDFDSLSKERYGVVRWRDRGLRAIVASFQRANAGTRKVEAGVVGSAADRMAEHSDITLGELALIQEFGTRDEHVPARPFMRPVAQSREGWQAVQVALAALIVRKQFRLPIEEILAKLGEHLVELIRHKIDDGVPPGNAEYTIKKKGFDHPLVDGGALREAISYRIISGAGKSFEVLAEGGDDYAVGEDD